MPAPVKRLLKVGFTAEQAFALQTRDDTTTTYAARSTVRLATVAGATVVPLNAITDLAVNDNVILARGAAGAETRTITAIAGIVARTAVRTATAAGATVLPVDDAAALAVDDRIIVARGTAVEEARVVTAVDLAAGANTVTVAALTHAHAVGEAVEERVDTITVAALTNAHAAGEAVEEVFVTATPAGLDKFVEAGFTARQSRLLRKTGPAATMKELLVQGKFTRPQAKLLLVP